ncbi:DUF3794 domain-containing protein [Anoxybacter fermentans]|uniref:DUF3794 domain-containing protein n=1 Tax=Anoxybacter fermentans TaxID=1323375 RepID=UPI0013DEE141
MRNKVIIQRQIIKNIIYKDSQNTVRHQQEIIPFSTDVEIPGFLPGVVIQNRRFLDGNSVKVLIKDSL